MNGMALYEGTSTVNSGACAVTVTRVPDHACRCDECVSLDEVDIPLLALCRRYLCNEIGFEEFRTSQVRMLSQLTPLQQAIQRNFDKGSADLDSAVEFCQFDSETEVDERGYISDVGPLREKEFRIRLEALVYGYEIRMRTVHFWTRGEGESKKIQGPLSA